MESEELREWEYAKENSRVCLAPLDSKDEQLPIRMFLPVLQNLQPTLRLPI